MVHRVTCSSLLAVATLAANALTHPLQAVATRGYAPGVVTAVLLVLPYASWIGRQGRREGWLSGRRGALLLAAGLVLQAPVAVLALLGGRALT
ncbi:MAG TPA: HXXEE domain-containing protein [Gemmatimonadaceae bacterium]|nr:HXXEE domain-containing protein [Gemmatimonadaceae bacterium]